MNTNPIFKVLLFEDNPQSGPVIFKAIKDELPPSFVLEQFRSTAPVTGKAYEDRLFEELKTDAYRNTLLIISDRDLSQTDRFNGLSEAIVSKVAAKMALPIAIYASGYTDDLLERQKQFGDVRIVLEPAIIGKQVAVLAQGFLQLKAAIQRVSADADGLRSPSAVMAQIMGRPGLAEQIALYGAGDQQMVAEILPFAAKKDRKQLEERLPCFFGYWLYDSILRFPGLLVNATAAASYLNIDPIEFAKSDIRDLFKDALYTGPFEDSSNPLWWRSDLDDIVQEGKAASGLKLAEKATGRAIKDCRCSVDPNVPAGWYCVATKQPVSFDLSVGNISWFPTGADLSRVRKDIYEEIGPWLGLF